MCKSLTVLSNASEDAPRSEKASTCFWHVPIKDRGFISPWSAHALVESQPVKQWNPNKTLRKLSFEHSVLLNLINLFSPTAYMLIRRRFSLVSANKNIRASISASFGNAIINTSVSGVAITMILYVQLACLACSSIHVSNSFWSE